MSRFGMRWISCSTPSTRKRTMSASSCGSKWMSEAPSSAAWKMIEFTMPDERRLRDAVVDVEIRLVVLARARPLDDEVDVVARAKAEGLRLARRAS